MNTTVQKSISINSTPEKVWSILTTDSMIRQRCTPFSPGTYAVTDRQLGSDISRFVGEECCVKGKLTTYEPNHKIVNTFYEGDAKNGFSDILKDTIESYEITSNGDETKLHIVSGPLSQQEWAECGEMMNKMRDEALIIIKNLSEQD